MICYSALLLRTAVSAAILRTHLMVWKVFEPRFMAAVLEFLAVHVAVLIGMLVGVERVVGRVVLLFKGQMGV
jgi:phosphatidylinositol glycan class O